MSARAASVSSSRSHFMYEYLAEGAVSGCVRASSMHHGTAQLYDAMYAYFSRDSVAMPGFAHFFQARQSSL